MKVLSFFLVVIAASFNVAAGSVTNPYGFWTAAPLGAGDLDPTFSQDGKLYDFIRYGNPDIINDTALQADGKIVAVGEAYFGEKKTCALSRYTSTGTPDPTFDGDGRVLIPTGQEFICRAVEIQADGKIVAAGHIGNVAHDRFALLRLNTNGSLDTTFDSDGIVVTAVRDKDDEAWAVAIQGDGKIVAAGRSSAGVSDFAIVRYNTDGSLDTSFGAGGKAVTSVSSSDRAYAVAIQPDGKIVAAGSADDPSLQSFAFVRLNPDGMLDTSFDSDGKLILRVGGSMVANTSVVSSLAIQPDGKIVAAGFAVVVTGTGFPPPQNLEFAVARLNPDGSLDTSFDGDGTALPTVSAFLDRVHSVALQADGKIVLAGSSEDGRGIENIAIARLTANGALDGSFNSTGFVVSPRGISRSSAHGVAVQPDGKIIAAGFTYYCCGAWENFAVLRYNSDGSLDPSFGTGGETNHDVGLMATYGRAVATQPDGKFVVAGILSTNVNREFAAIRYNADGTPDLSFHGDGKVSLDVLPGDDEALDVAIQADGKVIVAGFAGLPFNQPLSTDAALLRYNTDGSFDTTFDSDGKVITDIGVLDRLQSIAIQPDGKIVGAVRVSEFGFNDRIDLIRYNTNGSIDTTFDSDGRITATDLVMDLSIGLIIQPDGKLVVAGGVYNGTNMDFAVYRFNPDGSPDGTFDFDGSARTPIGSGNEMANAVAIQHDGKIVVAGFSQVVGNGDYAVVRYNPSGSLDTTFDGDGKLTTAVLGGTDTAVSVSIQPNGKIVAAGTSSPVVDNNYLDHDFSMTRYNPDGSLDNSFSGDGKFTLDFWGSSNDRLYGMALDASGRAIVVGEGTANFAVARVLGDFVPNGKTPFDFDGDGKADIAVYRPSTNVWYQHFSSGIPYGSPVFGVAGDVPVPADFDGDGKTDLAIFRPSNGDWWYRTSSDQSLRTVHWGAAGDIPLPSDINGDGTADFVVFRPSNNVWYRMTTNGDQQGKEFGLAGDKPVIGDFDGDGRSDHAIFRPSTGDWWYSASASSGQFIAVHWGQNGDVPAPADFDGDGKTDLAVFRPTNGGWYVLKSSDQSYIATGFGLNGDRPIPADYDGDGRADIAVFRPSTGIWYLLQSTAGTGGVQWGLASDVAIPNAFVQP